VEVTQCRKTWCYSQIGNERHGRTLSQRATVSKYSFLFRGAGGRYVVLCGKPRSCYLLGFLSNKNNITTVKYAVKLHDEVRDRRQAHLNAVMNFGQFQWPRCLRCGFVAARLLGLWVQIPARACMSVCCECCVLLGRGLCVGLIIRPEESYRVWCV